MNITLASRERRVSIPAEAAFWAVIALPFISLFGWLRGIDLAGADYVPTVNVTDAYRVTLHAWSQHQNLGQDFEHIYHNVFPHILLLGLLQRLGLDGFAASKLEIALTWSLGILGARLFFSILFAGWWDLRSAVGAILYGTNPVAYLLHQITTPPELGCFLCLPLAFAGVRLVFAGKGVGVPLFLLSLFLNYYGSENPGYAFLTILGSTLYAWGLVVARVTARNGIALATLCTCTAILINAPWLLPDAQQLLLVRGEITSSATNKDYLQDSIRRQRRDDAAIDIIRITNINTLAQDINDGPFGVASHYGSVLAPYIGSLLPRTLLFLPFIFLMLLLAELLRVPRELRDPDVIALTVPLAISAVLITGDFFPTSDVSNAIYQIPGAEIWRDPFSKIANIFALTIVSLSVYGYSLARNKLGAIRHCADLALIAYALMMALPLAFGRPAAVNSQGLPFLAVRVPSYYRDLGEYLDHVAPDSRILQTPISFNPRLEATNWGYMGPGLLYALYAPNVIVHSEEQSVAEGEDVFLTELREATENGNYSLADRLYSWSYIKYLLYRGDMWNEFGGRRPIDVAAAVRGNLSLSVIRTFGPLALLRNHRFSLPIVVSSKLIDAPIDTPGLSDSDIIGTISTQSLADPHPAGSDVAVAPLSVDGINQVLDSNGSGRLLVRLGNTWPYRLQRLKGKVKLVPDKAIADDGRRLFSFSPPPIVTTLDRAASLDNSKTSPADPKAEVAVDLRRAGLGGYEIALPPMFRPHIQMFAHIVGDFAGTWQFWNRISPERSILATYIAPTAGGELDVPQRPDDSSVVKSVSLAANTEYQLSLSALSLPSVMPSITVVDPGRNLLVRQPLEFGPNRLTFHTGLAGEYNIEISFPSNLWASGFTTYRFRPLTLWQVAPPISQAAEVSGGLWLHTIPGRHQQIFKGERGYIEFSSQKRSHCTFLLNGHPTEATSGASGTCFDNLDASEQDQSVDLVDGATNLTVEAASESSGSNLPNPQSASCTLHILSARMDQSSGMAQLDAPCGGYVALKTSFGIGWNADASPIGARASTTVQLSDHFRAWGYGNGWRVPPGRWLVTFVYKPESVDNFLRLVGIFICAAAVIAFAIGVYRLRRLPTNAVHG